ncbi:MAG: thrombospondin type 3 repeat-containing protein [Polyangiaceae bacterium]|nr:thrombospondin type 3 repeat-containing protein [Polyangiaceae bacterium]
MLDRIECRLGGKKKRRNVFTFIVCFGAFLSASPAFAQNKCPVYEGYCSPRTLFVPALDRSGLSFFGSSAGSDGQVITTSGVTGYFPGTGARTVDVGAAYQTSWGLLFSVGLPLALSRGPNNQTVFAGALSGGVQYPVLKPTLGPLGGFAVHASVVGQTPSWTADGKPGDPPMVEGRVVGSWRVFIASLQLATGVHVQPGRPGDAFRIPVGAALKIFLAPSAWNTDARAHLFFETLNYVHTNTELESHAIWGGMAYTFQHASIGAGFGWTKFEGVDSAMFRISWSGRRDIGDIDDDGIQDHDDRCKFYKEDVDGYQDTDGCPDDDNDGDGVLDSVDECKNVYGTEPNGCPAVASPNAVFALQGNVFDHSGTQRLAALLKLANLSLPNLRAARFFISSDNSTAAAAVETALQSITGCTGCAVQVTPDLFHATPASPPPVDVPVQLNPRTIVIVQVRAMPNRESPK